MKRHALSTRLWHWLIVVAVVILFMSGLNISNAHPWLYWGEAGFSPSAAWLALPKFPGWATIPGRYSLSEARDWHNAAALVFAFALLFAWAAMLLNGHFRRDLVTRRADWRWSAIRSDIAAHLRLDFEHAGSKFSFLQKLSYGLILGLLLPGLVLTGLGISPGLAPALDPLIDLMGGRQSARSLHFLFAWGLFAFFVLHVVLVLLSNPIKQMRDMITGGNDAP